MAAYDSLLAGWQARCPHTPEPVAVTLHAFRTIDRLAGPRTPPAYQVRFRCPACEEVHLLLLTETELDLAPVFEPLTAHYDLMLGRMDWQSGGMTELWQAAFRRGRWPLMLTCGNEIETLWCVTENGDLDTMQVAPLVAGWPSVLRAIEPDREPQPRSYQVHYQCPRCGKDGCEQWHPQRLELTPPVQF